MFQGCTPTRAPGYVMTDNFTLQAFLYQDIVRYLFFFGLFGVLVFFKTWPCGLWIFSETWMSLCGLSTSQFLLQSARENFQLWINRQEWNTIEWGWRMKQITFPKETTFRKVELTPKVEQDSVKNFHLFPTGCSWKDKVTSVVCSLDHAMILLLFSSPSVLIKQVSWECPLSSKNKYSELLLFL